jgi:hypothetical protein
MTLSEAVEPFASILPLPLPERHSLTPVQPVGEEQVQAMCKFERIDHQIMLSILGFSLKRCSPL